MPKWGYSNTYNSTKETSKEEMPCDVLALGWVNKHAKGHDLILLKYQLYCEYLPSNAPKWYVGPIGWVGYEFDET